ncbi:outer membrane beta-barrel protein [Limimaricola sp.]|uniref:outer membrane beta-barrel protein n=1 Tax=Limimaricola sp. TaxID=2211665 RepID=UPI0025C55A4F|nr:outer membrane beta-barrel protein [Limimaricola sp.]
MKPSVLLGLTASTLAMGAALPATAQQFYVGGGFDYGSTTLTDDIANTYDSHLGAPTLLAGVMMPVSPQFYLGAEIDTSLGANLDSSSFSGGSVDNVSRLRAIAGYQLPNFSVFASLGAVQYNGALDSGATGTSNGTTYGLGAQVPVTSNMDVRFEVIHDQVNTFDYGYKWDNTALRAAAVFRF